MVSRVHDLGGGQQRKAAARAGRGGGTVMTLTIRRGEPRDAAVVAEFNRRMAWETEHKHLDPDVLARGEHRRSGVFRLLYAEVMQQARTAGDVVGVRLYVERENTRAQATYRHLG